MGSCVGDHWVGEARRRGTFKERAEAAIKRSKAQFAKSVSDLDAENAALLRVGLGAFLDQIPADDWRQRRESIVQHLKSITVAKGLAQAPSVRVPADEIGWYLFLAQQALEDPLCLDVNQASRALPFLAAIGDRWKHAARVQGLDRKIKEVLKDRKAEPDGLIFETLVALSYAERGWEVELLKEKPPVKSPDLVARKDGKALYVECKRQSRRAAYAEKERNDFLRLWHAAREVLISKKQWVWIKAAFHVEVASLPPDYLATTLERVLPLREPDALIHEDGKVTLYARQIDERAVHSHLRKFRVKSNSPMLSKLLGGDWASLNSATTMLYVCKTSHVVGCEARILGTYIDEIAWACGITRRFDSEISMEKNARDVKNLLADAVRQVPDDAASVIHIAVETEDPDVERRRTEKVMSSIPSFIVDRPVLGVRLHLFQANQTIDKLWEFDETVEKFQLDGAKLDDIPSRVVIPTRFELVPGRHWELYGPQSATNSVKK